MGEQLTITVTGAEDVEAVQNGLEAAASELGGELKTGRGRASSDEVPKGEAAAELARAFTGWEPTGEE